MRLSLDGFVVLFRGGGVKLRLGGLIVCIF